MDHIFYLLIFLVVPIYSMESTNLTCEEDDNLRNWPVGKILDSCYRLDCWECKQYQGFLSHYGEHIGNGLKCIE